MMVQLQNPDRLNMIIELGYVDEDEDENDNTVLTFHKVIRTRCGRWSPNTSQMIQKEGLNLTHSHIAVVHHKNNWDGITHAKFNGRLYEVTLFNQDPYFNQTAYDLISLREVEKNG